MPTGRPRLRSWHFGVVSPDPATSFGWLRDRSAIPHVMNQIIKTYIMLQLVRGIAMGNSLLVACRQTVSRCTATIGVRSASSRFLRAPPWWSRDGRHPTRRPGRDWKPYHLLSACRATHAYPMCSLLNGRRWRGNVVCSPLQRRRARDRTTPVCRAGCRPASPHSSVLNFLNAVQFCGFRGTVSIRCAVQQRGGALLSWRLALSAPRKIH